MISVDDVLQNFVQGVPLGIYIIKTKTESLMNSGVPIWRSPLAYGGPSCNTNNGPLLFSHYFTSPEYQLKVCRLEDVGLQPDLPTV